MLIPKKERKDIYKYLFNQGVLWAPKDLNLKEHPNIPNVRNLFVVKAMQSFESKEYVTSRYAWQQHYWFLTDEGIAYLREYLNIPESVAPQTLIRQPNRTPPERSAGGYGGGRGGGGGYGGSGRGGGGYGGGGGGGGWRNDRDEYRGGPGGGGGGGGFGRGADKATAPEGYTPQFS